MKINKEDQRVARHKRIRQRLEGTADCPRIALKRSLKNMQLQLVDDSRGAVLFSLSTLSKELRQKFPYGGNVKSAQALGEAFARLASSKGISRVVFDRGGYAYHGRVKSLADALRKGGLIF